MDCTPLCVTDYGTFSTSGTSIQLNRQLAANNRSFIAFDVSASFRRTAGNADALGYVYICSPTVTYIDPLAVNASTSTILGISPWNWIDQTGRGYDTSFVKFSFVTPIVANNIFIVFTGLSPTATDFKIDWSVTRRTLNSITQPVDVTFAASYGRTEIVNSILPVLIDDSTPVLVQIDDSEPPAVVLSAPNPLPVLVQSAVEIVTSPVS